MTAEQSRRWDQLLHGIAETITPGPRLVVVDGKRHVAAYGDRPADTLAAMGQDCSRLSNKHLR